KMVIDGGKDLTGFVNVPLITSQPGETRRCTQLPCRRLLLPRQLERFQKIFFCLWRGILGSRPHHDFSFDAEQLGGAPMSVAVFRSSDGIFYRPQSLREFTDFRQPLGEPAQGRHEMRTVAGLKKLIGCGAKSRQARRQIPTPEEQLALATNA